MTEQDKWALTAATQDVIDMAARVRGEFCEEINGMAILPMGAFTDMADALDAFLARGGRLTEELEVTV